MLERAPYAFFGWGLNYPKQAETIKQWFKLRPKVAVWTGWKRTAKTFSGAYIVSCWFRNELNKNWPGARAMGIKESVKWPVPPLGDRTAWIGGKSSDHIENTLVPMYKTLIPHNDILRDITKNDKRIEGHHHNKLILRTYEQELEMWKSGMAHIVHLDEEPPIQIMNECLNRTATTNGPILITVAIDDADVSWLPDACANPKKYFGTDSFMHVKMGVEDVPDEIFPEVSKKSVYMKYDGTPFELAVRKGEFAYISGKWYMEFGDHNIIDPFPIPAHWLKWRMIDSGYSAPTACLWMAMHPKGDIHCYREFYRPGLTISERCKQIIELSGNKRQKEYDYWVEQQVGEKYVSTLADWHVFKIDEVTGDGSDQLWIREGLIIQESTHLGQEARRDVTNRFLEKNMSRHHFITNELGAPRVYIHSNCTNLLWEIQKKSVKREKTDKHGVSERKVDNRDDHLCDTLDYGCAELQNWVGVSEEDFNR